MSICHNFRLQNTSETWSLIKKIIAPLLHVEVAIYNCAQDRYISTDEI
uniref:Uncharacterized protein n=1 Tax=Lepeophtheirus salmonis TaxID=72036 RepID=A0A0K2TD70_LEPSM